MNTANDDRNQIIDAVNSPLNTPGKDGPELIDDRLSAISPFGLYTLLLILAKTIPDEGIRFELERLLRCLAEDDRFDSELQLFISRLSSLSLHMDMRVLAEKSLQLNETLVDKVKHIFHANFTTFDVSSLEDMPVNNDTAGKGSEGYIEATLVNINSRLLLFRSMHVNLLWYRAFDRQLTTTRRFFTRDKITGKPRQLQLSTMRMIDYLPYVIYPRFVAIYLRLCDFDDTHNRRERRQNTMSCDYEMVILLPHTNSSLESIENYLSWWSVLSSGSVRQTEQWVDLRMPRFNVHSRLSLIAPLQRLGVQKIFDFKTEESNRSANIFKGMFKSTSYQSRLKVDQIEQWVYFKVNEPGLFNGAPSPRPFFGDIFPEPFVIDVNRPFMFILWHKPTKLIISAGSVRFPGDE